MGSNWAEEFRQRVEESEGKYWATENLDDVDEEEEVELEESEGEAEEVEQEPEKPEIEKPLPSSVETPKMELERQRFRQKLDDILVKGTDQPAKAEVAKVEPAKIETNEWAGVGAAMIGLVVLSFMSTFYQAFQPLIQNFGGRSYGSQQWVTCPYCGYHCLGYDGVPCPRCGRS